MRSPGPTPATSPLQTRSTVSRAVVSIVAEKHVIQFAGPLKADTSSYLLQELHQHIDAYIAFLGLDKVMSLKELLGAGKPGGQ